MNLKDRLENNKKTNIIPSSKEEYNINGINTSIVFDDNETVKNIILNLLEEDKNIIYLFEQETYNMPIAYYMRAITNCFNSDIIKNIEKIDEFCPQICIVPSPAIDEIIKISEYIMRGYKSFIFGLKLKNYNNVIEKLKALIAINNSNLTEKNINTLISASDLVFIPISKNEEGFYYAEEINMLASKDNDFYLKNLYKYKNEEPEEAADVKSPSIEEEKKEEVDITTPDFISEEVQNTKITNILSDENAKEDENKEKNNDAPVTDKTVEVDEEKEAENKTDNEKNSIEETDKKEKDIIIEKKEEEIITNSPTNVTISPTEAEEEKNDEDKSENHEPPQKVNKYKLLKEKIKNKQNN